MKKLIFTVFTCIIFNTIYAQIPNASFESWSSIKKIKPDSWQASGSNIQTTNKRGGNFAIKLDINSDFMFYYNSYDGAPDTLTFWAKGMHSNGDSFNVIYFLYNKSIPLSSSSIKGHLSDTGNFVQYKIPVKIPTGKVSDTVSIIIEPSTLSDEKSYMIIDDISFEKQGITEGTFINGDFENWYLDSLISPDNWITFDDMIFEIEGSKINCASKSSDAIHGNSSLKLESKFTTFSNDVSSGFVFSLDRSKLDLSLSSNDIIPSFPVSSKWNSLAAIIKSAPKPGDTTQIEVTMFKNGNIIGEGFFNGTSPISSFTQVLIPISYTTSDIPDSATIYFGSGSIDVPVAGSVLYIDSLFFTMQTGVTDVNINKFYSIYPNPAHQQITIQSSDKNYLSKTIKLYSIEGKEIFQLNSLLSTNTIDISMLPAGIYHISITENNSTNFYKFTKLNNE